MNSAKEKTGPANITQPVNVADVTKNEKDDFVSSISEDVISMKKNFQVLPTITINRVPRQYEQHVYIAMLHWLVAGYFMFECTEVLLEAGVARQKVKMHLKALFPELEKLVNEDWGQLIGPDDLARATFSLQNNFEIFIKEWSPKQFIQHRPELLAGFAELLRQFHNAPEFVLHRNGIKIVQAG